MGYLYITGTILFTVYGQLILKHRIGRYGELPGPFADKVLFLLNLFLDPYIFSGFAAAFIAGLFWMAAMTKFELSFAYPFIIGGLVIFTGILSVIILKESITVYKAAGILLIVSGIYLTSRS